jgi:hypothetical protein
MDHDDSIPPFIKTVLDLFASDLAEVKFPDVDQKSLAEAALEAQAQAEEAAGAEEALRSAMAALAAKQEELQQKAQRALAYAAVYAQGNPELHAKVEAAARAAGFSKPRPAQKERATPPASADPQAAPRRRGRPPKAKPEPIEAEGEAGHAANGAIPLSAATDSLG